MNHMTWLLLCCNFTYVFVYLKENIFIYFSTIVRLVIKTAQSLFGYAGIDWVSINVLQ